MFRRRRPVREIAFSFDSFLDVVANVVGIILRLILVAWVGAPLTDASPEQALAAVTGYSTFNDLTARKAQKLTSQWILGKNGDRSGPIGPLVPAAETGDLRRLIGRPTGTLDQALAAAV